MAAAPDVSANQSERYPFLLEAVHRYHAEAFVLEANLEQPLDEHITPRVKVKLPSDGHYQFKHAEPFRFEGILSYHSGYTQVAGHPSTKTKGHATLSTSVLEGVNVLDVLTADRVVAQISTVHPDFETGQVPSVTFLGTRFENLRIGGHKIEVIPNLSIVGPRRDDDVSYFEDVEVVSRFSKQYGIISQRTDLPEEIRQHFPKEHETWRDKSSMRCSVVDEIKDVKRGHGTSFGHVIDVPHFGRIYLGELKITRELGNRVEWEKDRLQDRSGADNGKKTYTNDKYRFSLTMIRLEMGCLAKGTTTMVAADSNGTGSGTHH